MTLTPILQAGPGSQLVTLLAGVGLLFGLVFLANFAQARPESGLGRILRWWMILLNLPPFLSGLSLLLSPSQLAGSELGARLAEGGLGEPRTAGLILVLTAVWGLLATLSETRALLARVLPIDPTAPVHALALLLAGYVVGYTSLTLTQRDLAALANQGASASVNVLLLQALLMVALAAAGVGLFLRRDGWKTLERLGLAVPTGRQLLFGAGWIILLVVLQSLASFSYALFYPEQAEAVENVSVVLLGDIDTVGEWLVLALSAGIGEEIIFRGALQPVFGLWPTAALFAVTHIQYGITPVMLFVLLLGVVLGLIRQRTNTTVAILVHAGYNFALGLIALLLAASGVV